MSALFYLLLRFGLIPQSLVQVSGEKAKEKTARLGGSLLCCNVTEGKLKSKIHKHLFTIHYYLLPEILNAGLVKSEK